MAGIISDLTLENCELCSADHIYWCQKVSVGNTAVRTRESESLCLSSCSKFYNFDVWACSIYIFASCLNVEC
jgi:hypothetical protein